jgi:hypothetical protein
MSNFSAGGVAQVIEYLSSKHEALSQAPAPKTNKKPSSFSIEKQQLNN